jgi:hypothetical protein
MAPAAALLVVPDGLGSSEWQHAIVTCSHERPTARLYVFFQVRLQALCFTASCTHSRTAPRPCSAAATYPTAASFHWPHAHSKHSRLRCAQTTRYAKCHQDAACVSLTPFSLTPARVLPSPHQHVATAHTGAAT